MESDKTGNRMVKKLPVEYRISHRSIVSSSTDSHTRHTISLLLDAVN